MTLNQKTDMELISEYRFGEEAAITELFARYYKYSLRVARGFLRSEEDCQDAVQTGYFLAFRQLCSFRGDSAFKTWITRIVINCCLARLRKPEHRFTWIEFDHASPKGNFKTSCPAPPTPEQCALQQELGVAIDAAAQKLPEPLREAFHLYARSGLSLKEVAQTLGLSLPAAKSRVFRANSQMRSHLQPMQRFNRQESPASWRS